MTKRKPHSERDRQRDFGSEQTRVGEMVVPENVIGL